MCEGVFGECLADSGGLRDGLLLATAASSSGRYIWLAGSSYTDSLPALRLPRVQSACWRRRVRRIRGAPGWPGGGRGPRARRGRAGTGRGALWLRRPRPPRRALARGARRLGRGRRCPALGCRGPRCAPGSLRAPDLVSQGLLPPGSSPGERCPRPATLSGLQAPSLSPRATAGAPRQEAPRPPLVGDRIGGSASRLLSLCLLHV